MGWPFRDDEAFWAWAMDIDAELTDQDEDLLLHDADGLLLLVAAADRPDCPKAAYCVRVLEDFAVLLIRRGRPGELEKLKTAAAHGTQPPTLRWSGYVDRLFGYRTGRGPVNRAAAERMAADLLIGPGTPPVSLSVRIAPDGRHWRCELPGARLEHVLIDRRSGRWEFVR
jgi:hypothetical protein